MSATDVDLSCFPGQTRVWIGKQGPLGPQRWVGLSWLRDMVADLIDEAGRNPDRFEWREGRLARVERPHKDMVWTDEEIKRNTIEDSDLVGVSENELLPWKEVKRRLAAYHHQEEEITSLRAEVKRLRVFENDLTREHLAKENMRLSQRMLDMAGCIADAKRSLDQGSKT